ncbi:hypothetical protein [Streptomyces sp. RG80]|uniref:hypothetical protein n=1 Tax=Streptomyces sp. RG80 TaxID=3157340 RepID=UPI00338E7667
MTGPASASQSLTRVCPNCHGFATAAITTGVGRDHRGLLRTVTVVCPACRGTGTVPLRPHLNPADVEAAA